MIKSIKEILYSKMEMVNEWIDLEYQKSKPIIYSSVDIRNSEFKSAPVDTNLFPAGFNNFSTKDHEKATNYLNSFLKKYYPDCKNIILIPEFHTRNNYYIDSLLVLKKLFINAGCNLEFAFVGLEDDFIMLKSSNNDELIAYHANCINGKIILSNGFTADLIVINNDMSAGIPDLLKKCTSPIVPDVMHGWHTRSKFLHFKQYQKIIESFCQNFDIPDFFLNTECNECGLVDFKNSEGLLCIEKKVDLMLLSLDKKYKEFGITYDPYVFIKADKGTYGMGIMTASSGDDIKILNKKLRSKMSSLKNGLDNSSVIIQEGIPTIDVIDGNVSEPMIYLIDSNPFGQSFRTHEGKNSLDNLNSKGMYFKQIENYDPYSKFLNFTLARLATIAAANE